MLVEVLISMLFVVLIVVLLGYFKPLWLMNYLPLGLHSKRIKDLPYSDEDERHTLDLYIPKSKLKKHFNQHFNQESETKPVVVFIHGGAWDEGHKNDYKFVGLAFSEMGYITAVPNYRLYPQVRFPHFIEDVALAIANLPQILNQQGITYSNNLPVILVGHSAGAHSAAMLVSKSDYLLNAGANVSVKALVGLAGPYDLPLDDELVTGKFDAVQRHKVSQHQIDSGHVHNGHEANPINLATTSMPKVLLIHGAKDETVGPYHSERFSVRLTHLKVHHQHVVYKNTDHRHLVGGLSVLARFLNPVYKDIKRFLSTV